MFQLNTICN